MNKHITVKLGYNEHLVIKDKYFGPKCPFSTQIVPVITNPGPDLFVIIESHSILLFVDIGLKFQPNLNQFFLNKNLVLILYDSIFGAMQESISTFYL